MLYVRERKAQFLLTNAVDEGDYTAAVEQVRKLGLDPSTIPHRRPEAPKHHFPGT